MGLMKRLQRLDERTGVGRSWTQITPYEHARFVQRALLVSLFACFCAAAFQYDLLLFLIIGPLAAALGALTALMRRLRGVQ